MKFEDSVKGVFGSGFYRWTRDKVVVDYPVCKKHGLWLSVLQLAYPISIWGAVFGLIIHFSLVLFFGAIFLLNLFLRPVSIKKIGKYFYTIEIQNMDYAREFALLNKIDPYVE